MPQALNQVESHQIRKIEIKRHTLPMLKMGKEIAPKKEFKNDMNTVVQALRSEIERLKLALWYQRRKILGFEEDVEHMTEHLVKRNYTEV